MTAAQSAAFKATSGFAAAKFSDLVVGIVLAVLLVWGAWAITTAYKGWARGQVEKSALASLIARFSMIYLVLLAVLVS
ncbi:TIGR03758 family integrating conjugative element protein [Stutzerimonas stutzeri]|jgi:integrating conjugative element protein (TIGR03758 family)|uniref:TIGR03758 family integrating conjugative element protein n=1 Tax=Stutzerimonas kunmingensis TaxID=1211807 RepID=UPI00174760EC|nr:TIGR03758 family integrating conjugative element protein [Stutzerimonas kunmingensis]MCW8158232.1 TIGR03758 family integrating conjugative element protein [Stutzerimonas stutzeri]